MDNIAGIVAHGPPAEQHRQLQQAHTRHLLFILRGLEERLGPQVVDAYHEMIRLKTAVLFGAAASIPAVLLGADDEAVAALEAYGEQVGRAFQIQDDVLDLTVPSDRLGKRRGSDLVEGKRTLITVHAREHGVEVDGLLPEGEVAADDIDAAVEALEAAGSLDYAREAARDLADAGVAELEVLPDSAARGLLEDVGTYLVERGY